jgi:uncharacterized membrane protein YbjE (DUF340 family)
VSIIKYQFVVVIGAGWKKPTKRLFSSSCCKSWMLLIVISIAMMMRISEAYAVNVTVKSTAMSLTSSHVAVVMPTANIVSLMKGKKPIIIPENEVITSEDTEDYLEEDSEEDDYEIQLKKDNMSGECLATVIYVIYYAIICR